jgi:CRISPR-associated exonuclease Cas4
MIYLSLALLVLLSVALAAYVRARGETRRADLPAGRLVYSDTGFPVGRLVPLTESGPGHKQEKPLLSRQYGLVGRPDYLIRTGEGIVPVEAKSATSPAGGRAFDSHVMQLAAYCLLVQEAVGEHVPYGVIRYRDAQVRVPFTPELRTELIALLEEMREARSASQVHRSHTDARRCTNCSFRELCDEAL